MTTFKELQEAAKINWKKELEIADQATKNVASKQTAAARDDAPLMHDKTVGLYKADKSRNVMGPEEVRQRAITYINQYRASGHKVDDVATNADGSVTFTTQDHQGRIKHHTFHKTGAHASVSGGSSDAGLDHDDIENAPTDSSAPAKRGRPAGAKGAAAKANDGMSGKGLQDLLAGKISDIMRNKNLRGTRRVVKSIAELKNSLRSDTSTGEGFYESNSTDSDVTFREILLHHKKTGGYIGSTIYSPTLEHAKSAAARTYKLPEHNIVARFSTKPKIEESKDSDVTFREILLHHKKTGGYIGSTIYSPDLDHAKSAAERTYKLPKGSVVARFSTKPKIEESKDDYSKAYD